METIIYVVQQEKSNINIVFVQICIILLYMYYDILYNVFEFQKSTCGIMYFVYSLNKRVNLSNESCSVHLFLNMLLSLYIVYVSVNC